MYERLLLYPIQAGYSFFLFGPRGTGKTTWIRKILAEKHTYINLLESNKFRFLNADPSRIVDFLPAEKDGWVFIDEVQRIPELLNNIHFLIEEGYRFVLTGSSARKLRRGGVNLLGGRARIHSLFPLTMQEIGPSFDLVHALNYGLLPMSYTLSHKPKDAKHYLRSYIDSYIAEEVKEEKLVLNLSSFTMFLEVAALSQGSPVNMTNIARECYVSRLTVANYFSILEDLLLGSFILPFHSRAKREMLKQSKFYFFDVGVYRALRAIGPLDHITQVKGPALETLILQHLRALNDYLETDYKIHYWRTKSGVEVDFVLYKRDYPLIAIEVKGSSYLNNKDLKGLKSFQEYYPNSRCLLVYSGIDRMEKNIQLVNVSKFLTMIPSMLTASSNEVKQKSKSVAPRKKEKPNKK